MKPLPAMRITSRIYMLFALVCLIAVLALPIAFFQDSKDDRSVWLFIGVEILLALFSFLWVNCVDIYQETDDNLRCYFYGNRFEVPPGCRVRRVPFASVRSGLKFYSVGFISFRNETGNRRLKFFILADRDWHLIKER